MTKENLIKAIKGALVLMDDCADDTLDNHAELVDMVDFSGVALLFRECLAKL